MVETNNGKCSVDIWNDRYFNGTPLKELEKLIKEWEFNSEIDQAYQAYLQSIEQHDHLVRYTEIPILFSLIGIKCIMYAVDKNNKERCIKYSFEPLEDTINKEYAVSTEAKNVG